MDGLPSNALPFSRRERWESCQNAIDLVREAVGWNGMLACRCPR
jgi:hypothetical protein